MLTFLVCLLPVVATLSEPILENYILDISDNTLKNVRFIGDPDPVLNLSGRNLQNIKKNTFNYVLDLESLDLSNNSLTLLPEFIFYNLNKLKSLSLANNRLWKLQHLFLGLENLQVLDISGNPIHYLRRGSLFGLPKLVRILTDKNDLWSISTDMSDNLLFQIDDEMAKRTSQANTENEDREMEIIHDMKFLGAEGCKCRAIHKDTRLILCKSDGIVITLDMFWRKEELAEGCIKVSGDISSNSAGLHNQNITGFRKNWNRLYFLPIDLDFRNNRIAEIEKETLNDLPVGLTCVNFQNNQIRNIRSQVIKNNYLRELSLQNNLITKIEDNAFAKTRLHVLNLHGNHLTNLNFVSTLPDTMTKLSASRNRITFIPNNIFSRLPNLSYLNLRENKIETLQNDVFQNLISLQTLILAKNSIKTIEQGAFKGLTALKMLDFQRNFIRDLQGSTFAELTALRMLNLNSNKIVNGTSDLPRTLNALYLDFNEIGSLQKGSFVGAPRIALSLVGNYISSIARGAFNLPYLRILHLSENNLTTIEGDSYEGLGRLRSLWLSANQISEIRKGSCKNLQSLHLLVISSNPFQKLAAGTLYGLSTDAERNLHIYDNNLKEMQAGLFDDI